MRDDWDEGYDTYKRGEKIPAKRVSALFREGWFAAYDKRERFGSYETFLQAPDAAPRMGDAS